MTSERIASSLARPPALRITCASPSARPAYFAGSSRASMQVRIAKDRAGGSASSALSPKDSAYFSLAFRTSSRTLMGTLSRDEVLKANEKYAESFGDKAELALPP